MPDYGVGWMSQVVRKELDNIIYTQTNLGDDLRQLKTDVEGIEAKLPDSFDDFVTIVALNQLQTEVILLEMRVSLFSSSYCLFRLLGLALSNKLYPSCFSLSFFSRVHATLYVTMSVGRSVRRSVRNHFSFLGVSS